MYRLDRPTRNHWPEISVLFLIALAIVSLGRNLVSADTNINATSTDRYAWNDLIGWIDFNGTNSVNVTSQGLTGYASSSAGDVSLDCHTTRAGDICATSSYRITNDGMGNLSGYAWNDTYGWISFDCNNNGGCGTSSYRVYVDPNNGTFQNYAWNDIAGWVSFNCSDPGLCGSSSYRVVSSWVATSTTGTLDSVVYDTQVPGGAQINAITWYGFTPVGTEVHFQLASANATSGPWSFIGPDATGNSYYQANSGVPIKLDFILNANKRYFRYRAILVSNQAQTQSPRVDDVIINWSP